MLKSKIEKALAIGLILIFVLSLVSSVMAQDEDIETCEAEWQIIVVLFDADEVDDEVVQTAKQNFIECIRVDERTEIEAEMDVEVSDICFQICLTIGGPGSADFSYGGDRLISVTMSEVAFEANRGNLTSLQYEITFYGANDTLLFEGFTFAGELDSEDFDLESASYTDGNAEISFQDSGIVSAEVTFPQLGGVTMHVSVEAGTLVIESE